MSRESELKHVKPGCSKGNSCNDLDHFALPEELAGIILDDREDVGLIILALKEFTKTEQYAPKEYSRAKRLIKHLEGV